MCIPLDIHDTRNSRLPSTAVIRFAMPIEVGEQPSPGIIDEKVRCEAATYAWMQQRCPAVPIPRLLGMGFVGSCCVCSVMGYHCKECR
jgi:hypothetical protein